MLKSIFSAALTKRAITRDVLHLSVRNIDNVVSNCMLVCQPWSIQEALLLHNFTII